MLYDAAEQSPLLLTTLLWFNAPVSSVIIMVTTTIRKNNVIALFPFVRPVQDFKTRKRKIVVTKRYFFLS
jgi:hypothetical protein